MQNTFRHIKWHFSYPTIKKDDRGQISVGTAISCPNDSGRPFNRTF